MLICKVGPCLLTAKIIARTRKKEFIRFLAGVWEPVGIIAGASGRAFWPGGGGLGLLAALLMFLGACGILTWPGFVLHIPWAFRRVIWERPGTSSKGEH